MCKYLDECYLETFKRDVLPLKEVKFYEPKGIYLSLGSIVFFKTPNSFNYPHNSDIELRCGFYKNDYKISNVVVIRLGKDGVKRVYKEKFRNANPIKGAHGSNLFYQGHSRAKKGSNRRNRTGTTWRRTRTKCKLSTNHFTISRRPFVTSFPNTNTCKLRDPLIVNINTVLIFKIKNIQKYLKNRVNSYFYVDLYVDNQFIASNCKRLILSELDGSYNTLYHYNCPSSSFSTPNGCPDGCCCDIVNGVVCSNHVLGTVRAISSLVNTPYDINSMGYKRARLALYKKLQLMHYMGSTGLRTCNGVDLPVSLTFFSVSTSCTSSSGRGSFGATHRGSSGGHYEDYKYVLLLKYNLYKFKEHEYDPPSTTNAVSTDKGSSDEEDLGGEDDCDLLLQLLYKFSDILSVNKRDLLLIRIPTEFRVLQLLYSSSLLGVHYHTSSGVSTTVNKGGLVNLMNKWYNWADINQLIIKYSEQLVKDDNAVCLFLRFTDYGSEEQVEFLLGFLTRINSSSNRSLSTSTLLELISSDFTSLTTQLRLLVVQIVALHLTPNFVRMFQRQLVTFLKFDLNDFLFNRMLELIGSDAQMAVNLYYLLKGSSTAVGTTTSNNSAGVKTVDTASGGTTNRTTSTTATTTNTPSGTNHGTISGKYLEHLITNNHTHVMDVIQLGDEFVSIFSKLLTLISATRRTFKHRNRLLHSLLSHFSNELIANLTGDRGGRVKVKIDRQRGLITFDPSIPVLTDVSRWIESVDYKRSSVYKSSSYPLILVCNTSATTNCFVVGSGFSYQSLLATGSSGTTNEHRLMLKMSDVRNDHIYFQVLRLFNQLVSKRGIWTVTYDVVPVGSNLGYLQLLSPTTTNHKPVGSTDDDNTTTINSGGKRGWTSNFINSLVLNSILTYLLQVGDRHYENVLLLPAGFIVNVDFTYLFGNDPSKLLLPPFRVNKEYWSIIRGLDLYDTFVEKFTWAFKVVRRRYKLVLNLLYSGGVPLEDVVRVEERFLLDKGRDELDSELRRLIKESEESWYPEVIDSWHKFSNLFK